MKINAPDFINSEYLIVDELDWRSTDDAPEEFKKLLEEFLASIENT